MAGQGPSRDMCRTFPLSNSAQNVDSHCSEQLNIRELLATYLLFQNTEQDAVTAFVSPVAEEEKVLVIRTHPIPATSLYYRTTPGLFPFLGFGVR